MSKSVTESYLSNKIKKTTKLKIGEFYFFEDFVVIEYAEDAVISLAVLQNIIGENLSFFNNKPFGIIVNKIHPYNTVPTDAMKLEKQVPNLIATAVVTNDITQTINFDLENHFFKHINRQLFSNLELAEKWITQKILDANKNN